MMLRRGRTLGAVCCLVLLGLEPVKDLPTGEALWHQGQEAMRQGLPGRAIVCYEKSLARAPGLTRNYLSLAAAYLEVGDPHRACVALGRYVACHPKDLEIRAQYAELLFRQRRAVQARIEFEACTRAAEEQEGTVLSQLIRCHSRLMEIAGLLADSYGQHLHRGIGLYLLAQASSGLEAAETEMSNEGLLCRAAGELALAQDKRPEEARPCWYLFEVWSKLARQQPAQRCLQDALQAAPFTDLTPAERRGLYLAWSDAARAGARK